MFDLDITKGEWEEGEELGYDVTYGPISARVLPGCDPWVEFEKEDDQVAILSVPQLLKVAKTAYATMAKLRDGRKDCGLENLTDALMKLEKKIGKEKKHE